MMSPILNAQLVLPSVHVVYMVAWLFCFELQCLERHLLLTLLLPFLVATQYDIHDDDLESAVIA
jgi:hypothetical protein